MKRTNIGNVPGDKVLGSLAHLREKMTPEYPVISWESFQKFLYFTKRQHLLFERNENPFKKIVFDAFEINIGTHTKEELLMALEKSDFTCYDGHTLNMIRGEKFIVNSTPTKQLVASLDMRENGINAVPYNILCQAFIGEVVVFNERRYKIAYTLPEIGPQLCLYFEKKNLDLPLSVGMEPINGGIFELSVYDNLDQGVDLTEGKYFQRRGTFAEILFFSFDTIIFSLEEVQ